MHALPLLWSIFCLETLLQTGFNTISFWTTGIKLTANFFFFFFFFLQCLWWPFFVCVCGVISLFIHLKARVSERQTAWERKRYFNYWFTPKLWWKLGLDQAETKSQEVHSQRCQGLNNLPGAWMRSWFRSLAARTWTGTLKWDLNCMQ